MLHFAYFLEEFRGIPPREPPISGTRVTHIWREKGPHVTVKDGYAHRFLPFLSLCC